MMKGLFITTRQSRGFTLIEALIAMVILASGLLAIARFQAGLVSTSGSNKARAEAIALAQEKIDAIRAYNNDSQLYANVYSVAYDASKTFSDDVATDSAIPDTAESIAGTNATFSRQWSITAGATSTAAVLQMVVSWEDPKTGNTDSVTLGTDLFYRNPEQNAAIANANDTTSGYPTSSGDAIEGSGKYGSVPNGATSNDDGTYTYQNTAASQVELIDSNGYILLTLKNACETVGGNTLCKDFNKISGLVWFDEGDANATDLFVNNSPGSACVEKWTSVVDTGDYQYFPYNCYMGANWFGNVAILENVGVNQRNDICVGDSATDAGVGIDEPEAEGRRIYRGLLSQDENYNLVVDDDNSDGIGDYQTIGAMSELVLPNPYNSNINTHYNDGYYLDSSTNLYLPGHNFLVLNLGNSDTCASKMIGETEFDITITDGTDTRTVNAFEGSPDTFVCYNQAFEYSYTDGSLNTITAIQPYFSISDSLERIKDGYLKNNNDQIFFEQVVDGSSNYRVKLTSTTSADGSGNVSATNNLTDANNKYFMNTLGCGFNPVIVPSQKDQLTGSIFSGDASTNTATGFVINMSDDQQRGVAGNCTLATGAGTRIFDYTCDFYHTYVSGVGEGWTGNVVIDASTNTQCSPATITHSTALTADVGNHNTTVDSSYDFTCTAVGGSGGGGAGGGAGTTVTITFTDAASTIDYGSANSSNTIASIKLYPVDASDNLGSPTTCTINTGNPSFSCNVTLTVGSNHGVVIDADFDHNQHTLCGINANTSGSGSTGNNLTGTSVGLTGSKDTIWIGRSGYTVDTTPSIELQAYKTGGNPKNTCGAAIP